MFKYPSLAHFFQLINSGFVSKSLKKLEKVSIFEEKNFALGLGFTSIIHTKYQTSSSTIENFGRCDHITIR